MPSQATVVWDKRARLLVVPAHSIKREFRACGRMTKDSLAAAHQFTISNAGHPLRRAQLSPDRMAFGTSRFHPREPVDPH